MAEPAGNDKGHIRAKGRQAVLGIMGQIRDDVANDGETLMCMRCEDNPATSAWNMCEVCEILMAHQCPVVEAHGKAGEVEQMMAHLGTHMKTVELDGEKMSFRTTCPQIGNIHPPFTEGDILESGAKVIRIWKEPDEDTPHIVLGE